jgi:hypothetical protein
MIAGVALVGCAPGTGPVEPEPPAAAVEEEETPEAQPERELEEGGADAALPPEEQVGENQG